MLNPRHQVVLSHRWLVESIISKYRLAGVGNDDLMQEGMIGLMRAAESHDPKKSKFSTWAFRAVRNQVTDYVRSEMRRNGTLVNGIRVGHLRLDEPIAKRGRGDGADGVITLLDTMISPLESPEDTVSRRQEHRLARYALRWAARRMSERTRPSAFAIVGNLLSINPVGFRVLAGSTGISRDWLRVQSHRVVILARSVL